jgi:hypothetical protein
VTIPEHCQQASVRVLPTMTGTDRLLHRGHQDVGCAAQRSSSAKQLGCTQAHATVGCTKLGLNCRWDQIRCYTSNKGLTSLTHGNYSCSSYMRCGCHTCWLTPNRPVPAQVLPLLPQTPWQLLLPVQLLLLRLWASTQCSSSRHCLLLLLLRRQMQLPWRAGPGSSSWPHRTWLP